MVWSPELRQEETRDQRWLRGGQKYCANPTGGASFLPFLTVSSSATAVAASLARCTGAWGVEGDG